MSKQTKTKLYQAISFLGSNLQISPDRLHYRHSLKKPRITFDTAFSTKNRLPNFTRNGTIVASDVTTPATAIVHSNISLTLISLLPHLNSHYRSAPVRFQRRLWIAFRRRAASLIEIGQNLFEIPQRSCCQAIVRKLNLILRRTRTCQPLRKWVRLGPKVGVLYVPVSAIQDILGSKLKRDCVVIGHKHLAVSRKCDYKQAATIRRARQVLIVVGF